MCHIFLVQRSQIDTHKKYIVHDTYIYLKIKANFDFYPHDGFMRAYVITLLGNKIGYLIPKVESGLLQIEQADRWNFSQPFFEKKSKQMAHYKNEIKPK